jgi:peptide-methionine (R)-S-oxide reductase
MNRRQLLQGLGAYSLTAWVGAYAASSAADVTRMRRDWAQLRAQSLAVVDPTPPLERAVEEWRQRLPEDAYAVLFDEDTERPFTSALNDEKRAGLFVCRACGLPLFTSEMKYESSTGWPSFFTSIPDHLATKLDFKLILPRTEYHCVKCGGHQGHVFDDGPSPTGERWCNNGVALDFVPQA